MTYKVKLSESVIEEINDWGLSDTLHRQFLFTIRDRLTGFERDEFREIVAPVRAIFDKFTIEDEPTGITHRFFIWFNDTQEENTRINT